MPEHSIEVSKVYVKGNGDGYAKIAIVGESPTINEVSSEMAMSGIRNSILQDYLKPFNLSPGQVWKTYACKYFVPPNTRYGTKKPFKKRAEQVGINTQEQYNELMIELNDVKPNIIISLGQTALYATLGKFGKDAIDSYRGSIIPNLSGIQVIPTYDIFEIQNYITDGWQRTIAKFDFRRAFKYSEIKYEKPYHNLQVVKSSAQLWEFINRKIPKEGRFRVGVDIEARECIPVCIGIAFDEVEGMTLPLWNIPGHSTMSDYDLARSWLLMQELLFHPRADIIGQNFKYDQDKIERLGFRIRRLAGDVMLKGHAINAELPKKLAFFISIFTENPFHKDEGMYEGKLEDLFIGCALDSCNTVQVDKAMDGDLDQLHQREYYENFLMQLHESYLRTERIGFKINEQVKLDLIKKYVVKSEELAYELFCLAGGIVNTGSPKQVDVMLYENFGIPRRSGTGEEVLTQLLGNTVKDPKHRRAIEIVLDKRKIDKTIDTYLMALPDYDGRMKTTFYLCLNTGRTSTGQLDPPIRPSITLQKDGKKKESYIGQAFQTMTKHGEIGADVRVQYEADEGEVFLNIDSSQAEARVVFLLADDEEALYAIDHHDYHALTASWFFGGVEDDWSKKKWGFEHPIRFCGKTLRHACHLGASKNRAAITVNTDARKYKILKPGTEELFTISESFAGQAIKIFHVKQPKIRANFHVGIQNALAENKQRLTAGLPYGIESEYGGIRTFYDKWTDDLFRQAYSYIPQRTVSDNTKAAKIRIEHRLPGIKIVLESHDALLIATRINDVKEVARVAREEMERPISFRNCSLSRRELVIPSEVEIGENYKDFRKYKE